MQFSQAAAILGFTCTFSTLFVKNKQNELFRCKHLLSVVVECKGLFSIPLANEEYFVKTLQQNLQFLEKITEEIDNFNMCHCEKEVLTGVVKKKYYCLNLCRYRSPLKRLGQFLSAMNVIQVFPIKVWVGKVCQLFWLCCIVPGYYKGKFSTVL